MILDFQRPAMWMWLNICVIVASAATVVYPPVRQQGAFIVAIAVFAVVYFGMLVRRLIADGTATSTVRQVHAQVKQGRRLPRYPLETAAAIALLASSLYAASGHGA